MALRFPRANTWFQKQTDTNLLPYAQNIKTMLLAAIATFPTPPVLPAALQIIIDAYAAALSLATGPGAGKIYTSRKNAAKLTLINALRQDCQYVNQIVTGLIASGTSYDAAQVLILSTGYQLSKDPVPAGPMPPVEIIRYGSYTKSQFYILAQKLANAKGYVVKVSDNTEVGPQFEMSFPSTRMTLVGLKSGHSYTFEIAAIGANPIRNFATQITDAVVI